VAEAVPPGNNPRTMPDDVRWLRYALQLALESVEAGDYAFGAALVTQDDQLLLSARQTVAVPGTRLGHAELNVLLEAQSPFSREQIAGCTLYSSTEPCPMCSGAIGWSVNRLVFGLSQKRMYELFRGTSPPRFRTAWDCRTVLDDLEPPMEVVGPLLEDEAAMAHAEWARREERRG
jgi:tRNA(Arg) A34 adenosine deaminase TadA